ncbi:MAG: cyclic nucleotide-binding domain-containing protein [Steroidobacteraceae bacterium]|jgi:CRP-like cAMP-binding protein|nr:cyclic nucleotide-binding domain-containing protein [Steroidobacteraceae bacterium]
MQPLTDVVLASPLGKELARPEAEALAAIVRVRDLADGEVLLPEGARDSHLHVILDGRVNVARRVESGAGWNVLYSLSRGDLVGELSFMDDEPRYASLVASGPTRVLMLGRADFEQLLASQPLVVYKVMRAIMRVAHDVQRRLSRQMLELQNYLYRPGAKY